MISLLLSLFSLWTTTRANGSPPANGGTSTYLGLEDLHTQEMGGRTDPGVGPSWPGSVAPLLPWVLLSLCTLPPPFAPFWRCHPRVQDGGSPCMKSNILRFNPQDVPL
jgi:hypothetical protein